MTPEERTDRKSQPKRNCSAVMYWKNWANGNPQTFPETGGMEYRMSENGSTYPNGQARDYYGNLLRRVWSRISSGVIIELHLSAVRPMLTTS